MEFDLNEVLEGNERNCHGMWEVTEPLSGN